MTTRNPKSRTAERRLTIKPLSPEAREALEESHTFRKARARHVEILAFLLMREISQLAERGIIATPAELPLSLKSHAAFARLAIDVIGQASELAQRQSAIEHEDGVIDPLTRLCQEIAEMHAATQRDRSKGSE